MNWHLQKNWLWGDKWTSDTGWEVRLTPGQRHADVCLVGRRVAAILPKVNEFYENSLSGIRVDGRAIHWSIGLTFTDQYRDDLNIALASFNTHCHREAREKVAVKINKLDIATKNLDASISHEIEERRYVASLGGLGRW